MDRASVSVIIPVYQADSTFPRVLEALRPQVGGGVEVIVVESSGAGAAARLQASHPWLRVLAQAERTLSGRARNLGAAAARGSVLVFLDADAVPAPDWLDRLLLAASRAAPETAAVAGAVANGTPASAVGTSSYLLEFSEFLPGRAGRPRHGASCNLLVRRTVFEAVDGFAEDLWPGEDTVLTIPWVDRGLLAFAPEAVVTHINRDRFVEFVRHQYRLGRSFAVVCDRVDFPHGWVARWPLVPVAIALRLAALALRLRGRVPRASVTLTVAAGLLAWGTGMAAERLRPAWRHVCRMRTDGARAT